MSPASVAEARRRNLAAGQRLRIEGAREWHALVGADRAEVAAAMLDPSTALASKRLSTILMPGGGSRPGLIPGLGRGGLGRAFDALAERHPHGRPWHGGLRLGELFRHERERLIDALVEQAPKWWRES